MDKLPLDAAALEELRGRTFLPGPATTDRLVEQSRAALDLRDRVATLEAELAEARTARGDGIIADLNFKLITEQAHANALRDALLRIQIGCGCGCDDFAAKALAQTPAASLAAAKDSLRSHDAEVLERAAVKCDEIVRGHSPENARVGTGRRHETKMLAAGAKMCAGAIRALAAQAATHSVPDGTSEVTK